MVFQQKKKNLNNAFTNKNYKINVKENYSLKKPLIVYHLTTNKIYKKNINLRLNFNLESNSSLRLIDYFEDNSKDNFINIFYNFDLEKNSSLKIIKLTIKITKTLSILLIILIKKKIVFQKHLYCLLDQVFLRMRLIVI